MNNFPNLEEAKVFISKLDIEMAAEKDGIFAEILQYCGNHFADIMHRIILNI